MSRPEVRRGQIWLVDWSPARGSEQLGRRPALVIQTDAANTNPRYPNTIVLTLSSKGLPVATHVEVVPDARNGLRETSWVKCEQVLTISKDRLVILWGTLSAADVAKVERSLKLALALA
ncbi:MAG TPA: type II toxin-antitoxin system PemK/MazF family toxin [Candidatus Paceibacterota bacterium]|nr:type II toxin-antitoxin system PemK/MazF family toxin [Candidatus Paceibacterota bacterium]HSA03594.1 type II toxin-antitoxin system PemK/MazF family toxin [Candidatus Paceibacterota bacterium]